MNEIQGERVLILGYGREGQSTHRFLLQNYPKLDISVADKNPVQLIPESGPKTATYSGEQYLGELARFTTIIRSPGISLRELSGTDTGSKIHITSATNLFFSHSKGRIVGVTGTKGKSTTSSLVAHILKNKFPDVRLAGNIGKPMLEVLQGQSTETIFVLELSSFQLEDLRYSPNIGILLDIFPEHLDHHGSLEAYAAAKGRIGEFQSNSDKLLIHYDSKLAKKVTNDFRGERIAVGEPGKNAWLEDEKLFVANSGSRNEIIKINELPLSGSGNLKNILIASACGTLLGVTPKQIRESLSSFKPLAHRLEFVGERSGIKFYNDSLATIPEALANALDSLGPNVETVIAGGHDRGIDYTVAGEAISNSNVKNLILFPNTGEKIWAATKVHNRARNIVKIDISTMKEAVDVAFEVTTPGKICVLSPASSSFNLFKDYQDRGEQFKNAVLEHDVSSKK